MNAEIVISLIIGSVGAVTGVIALIWNIISSRPEIKLESSWIIQEENGIEVHTFKIINHRDKPINIQSYGYMSEKGDKYPYMPRSMTEIPGKDTVIIDWTLDELMDEFDIETRGKFYRLYVEDGVGNFYTKRIRKS